MTQLGTAADYRVRSGSLARTAALTPDPARACALQDEAVAWRELAVEADWQEAMMAALNVTRAPRSFWPGRPGAHPTTRALTAYALGAWPQADPDATARHLAACTTCSAVVTRLEDAEGRRLLAQPPAALRPGALDIALALATPDPLIKIS